MSGEATGVPSTCGLWGARGGRGWTGRTGRGQDPYLPARPSVHLLVQRSLSGYDGPEPAGGEKPRMGIILVRLFLETAQTQRLILSSVCFAGDGAEAQEALGSPRLGGKWGGGRRPSFHKGRRPHHLFLGRGARCSVADGPASFLVLRGVPISRLTPHFCSMPRPFFLTLSYAPRLCEDLLARFHSLCVLNCPRLFWHADRIAVPSDLGGCRRLPSASASVPGCWASIGTPGPSP